MIKLIAMQENLGLGHKGNILITTQERVNKNEPPIANNIIDESYANEICNRYNAFEEDGLVDELRTALKEAKRDFYYIHQHTEDTHVDSYNFMEKVKAAIAKAEKIQKRNDQN